jgi:hypothetical protein
MRPNNNQRGRQRGRNGGGKPNKPQRNQTFDSSGPEVRVRGNAHQIFEKYQVLAREASAAGDRIAAESYYQHAEHYLRMINAMGGFNRPQDQWRDGDNPDDQGGERQDGRSEGRPEGRNDGRDGGRPDNRPNGQPSNGGYHGQDHFRQDSYGRDQHERPRDIAEAEQPDASFGPPPGREPQEQP